MARAKSGDAVTLNTIERELEALEDAEGLPAYYRNYWMSYLLYHKAINLMATQEFGKGKIPLEQAMLLLNETEPRDAEVVALLSLVAGLHLAYVPRHRIIGANAAVHEYLAESLELDRNNKRALYANAVVDFNIPEEYGGKKETERLLKKALAAPLQEPAGLAPRWGRRESTTLLVQLYVEQKRLAQARDVVRGALAVWPNDPRLRRLDEQTRDIEVGLE